MARPSKIDRFIEVGDLGKEFCPLIKKALRNQKENLFKKFSNDDRAWQRWAWIIERKFSEWNLKNINENKNENTHTGEIKINYNLPNGD
jgi:DNA-binding MarR family transcriptional regulator